MLFENESAVGLETVVVGEPRTLRKGGAAGSVGEGEGFGQQLAQGALDRVAFAC